MPEIDLLVYMRVRSGSMAKKRVTLKELYGDKPAETQSDAGTESKLEEFAEDLGRLLGTAQLKAQGWMDQRKAIAEHLTGLRDTANRLLEQLGGDIEGPGGARRQRGRPRKQSAPEANFAPAPLSKKQRRKKRTMSAEAREKIAAAQRARWAKQKRAAKG